MRLLNRTYSTYRTYYLTYRTDLTYNLLAILTTAWRILTMNDRKPDLIPAHGGYRKLKSYQQAELVYDATVKFCDRFIDTRSRTHDQMVQGQTPVGVQIVANRFREDLCLRAAETIEARGTPPAPIDPRTM
jgi:hypothetical protein